MSEPLFVISSSARTPLGHNSATSAAAIRASMSSCSEHPFMLDQTSEPAPASLDTKLAPDLPCKQRMLALAQSALEEACLPLNKVKSLPTIPLLLGAPEPRPGFTEQDAQWLGQRLCQLNNLPVTIENHRAYMSGHSSVLSLLHQAEKEMAEGRYSACLIGGVESYFHRDTMAWLDENRQLLGRTSRSGFVPGEGASFCLVTTANAAQQAGLTPLAFITNSACQWETKLIKTQDINLGQGLTQAIDETISHLNPHQEHINNIYCDINGERYRGEEWGFTCLKLAQYFDDPTGYWSPADCWGDMGAASGGLFLSLAIQSAQRGYANGKNTLLWTGSENGLRAATLIEANVTPSPFRG